MNYLNLHSWYNINLIWPKKTRIIWIILVIYQVCKFKVGSFNYPMSKMTFLAEVFIILMIISPIVIWTARSTWSNHKHNHHQHHNHLSIFIIIHYHIQFVPEDSSIKSILDYKINFNKLDERDTHYMAIGRDITVFFELV